MTEQVLRKVHLHGHLAERFGKTHVVASRTISEALRVIECNEPGFLIAVRRSHFHVLHGDRTMKRSREVHPHQLFVPRERGDWHLVPVMTGGKGRTGKAIFSIIVGGALLATGIGGALAGAQATLAGTGATISVGGLGAGLGATAGLGLSYGTLALMGAGFFLGGINQLLAPTPKGSTANEKPTSFTFSGPESMDDEGGPIPLVFGEVICSGVRIASAITGTAGSVYVPAESKWGQLFDRSVFS